MQTSARWWLLENVVAYPAIAVMAMIAMYWLSVADREPPLQVLAGRIEPAVVRPGEDITVYWSIRQLRNNCSVESMRNEIVDSQGTAWQIDMNQMNGQSVSSAGGVIARMKSVPFGAAWGPARYRRTSCYSCSGLSLTQLINVCRVWPEVAFQINPR